ncbi:gp625 [Bacillus phage G]|uniref:Gp625 n=1 Tax=Bacillus phage G TaxID=2884420 RepID=G3MB05_9CAUD|nr:gp625 [Bacillus phage G]AEO93870.1 gp625 [Bacillus phage G]
MSKPIFTYRETKNVVIKMCLSCRHVQEFPESRIECPSCKLVGHMGFWDKPEGFQKYVRLNKPTGLKIIGEHLQYIYDEEMGNELEAI